MSGPRTEAVRADVGIVIPNLDTRAYLERCLGAVPAAAPGLAVDVVVVDNGSADGSQSMVRRQFPLVRLLENRVNVGFAAAVNQGASAVASSAVLVLNSDCELAPRALAVMVGELDRGERVGAVLCRLLNPDGTLQPSVHRRFPGPSGAIGDLLHLPAMRHRLYRSPWLGRWLLRGAVRSHGRAHDVAWGGATCLLVRRRAWDEVGGLDASFFFFWEDVDFCKRLREAGWRVRYVPDASAVHHWGKASANVHPTVLREAYRSRVRYFEKHFPGPGARFVRRLAILELAARWAALSALDATRGRERTRAVATRACLAAVRRR